MSNTVELEPNNSTSQATQIDPGVAAKGQLQATSDQDHFKFTVGSVGNLTYTFDAPGNTSAGLFQFALLNSSGTVLANYELGSDKTLTTAVGSAGTYYFRACWPQV